MAFTEPDRDARASGKRRTDPQRRDRIIEACLEVIAQVGVAGASHRRIAAAADVPLGSMTYHFSGMEELLREAFTRFAGRVSTRFENRMAAADVASAETAVTEIILHDVFSQPDDLVLTAELYALAARNPAYRDITTAWMKRSRAALSRRFDPDIAQMLDALIEGFTIQRALDSGPHDATEVHRAVARLANP